MTEWIRCLSRRWLGAMKLRCEPTGRTSAFSVILTPQSQDDQAQTVQEVFPDPTIIYVLRFQHAARGTPQFTRSVL